MTDSHSPTRYLLQLKADPTLCIGVASTAPGTNAVLYRSDDSATSAIEWCLDPNTGLIVLAVTWDRPRVLAVGGEPQNGVPVLMAEYVTASPDQLWNWIGTGGTIVCAGQPSFCLDNTGGIQQPGNPIQIYHVEDNQPNQIWCLVPVFALEESRRLVGADA